MGAKAVQKMLSLDLNRRDGDPPSNANRMANARQQVAAHDFLIKSYWTRGFPDRYGRFTTICTGVCS